jgi:hypothetical protein
VSHSGHHCGRKFKTRQAIFTGIPARLTRYTTVFLHTGQARSLVIRLNNMTTLLIRAFG